MSSVSALKRWVRIQNPKFAFLQRYFGNKPFQLLDIGTGNSSASKTISLFPNCNYYGLDLSREYNNTPEDFALMKEFYEIDLTKLEFSQLPDNFFDAILIVHVIEHLHNGDEVLKAMLPKLKKGGLMYVEYPGKRSTKLPSMRGTLNYYDDSSHVRIYSLTELSKLFIDNAAQIVSLGTRRSKFYLVMTPVRMLGRWVRGKAVTGNVFWDLLGFAEYVVVRK
ncbi:MAG: class I SAM-dependent methyltransferase [Chitinophagaceae bacterium]|nr:class I SAM-dependent methyltransferase [Chitinophagaceae bacterium]